MSRILPQQRADTVDFARYSPQSRRIMDLFGLYEDKSQEPVYGSHIPVPLEPRLPGFREPEDFAGLGYEPEEDEDGYCYMVSIQGENTDEGISQIENTQEQVSEYDKDEKSSQTTEEEAECAVAPPSIEDGDQPTVDELEEVNLL